MWKSKSISFKVYGDKFALLEVRLNAAKVLKSTAVGKT